eukprot:CAMPEP_0178437270 /NCGR_PEP_ID=MMETSP0689_2-20121128/34894_1 /TAXON_ID=160604 /ORGANISM="Amphidinium massartii, Strain CS-259" /LENGTH=31 /DNA_ID= /DNA_START= /DNA_END= /DNA_ORIENTATION=
MSLSAVVLNNGSGIADVGILEVAAARYGSQL